MTKLFQFVWRERWQLTIFVVIGGLSFGIWSSSYYLLSRHLWIAGNHTFENFLSVVIASLFNFFAHRYWTFRAHHQHHIKQLPRYVLVLITSMLLQSFLFWLGHEVFHLYDFAVAIVVMGLIALYTYTGHRFFTFHHSRK